MVLVGLGPCKLAFLKTTVYTYIIIFQVNMLLP